MLGVGVMIEELCGNEKSVEAYKRSLGKEIESIAVDENFLTLWFKDKTKLDFHDAGQSCCESRYMTCDDDLDSFKNSTFIEAELRSADNLPCEYDEHEVRFLIIKTSKGNVSIANHNKHNGYYGGFAIRCS